MKIEGTIYVQISQEIEVDIVEQVEGLLRVEDLLHIVKNAVKENFELAEADISILPNNDLTVDLSKEVIEI